MGYASPASEGKSHYVLTFRHGGKVNRVDIYSHTPRDGMKKGTPSVHVHNLGNFRKIFQAMPTEDKETKSFYVRKYQKYWERMKELCDRYSGVLASYHGHLEERSQQEKDVVDKIAHGIKHAMQNLEIIRHKARKTRLLNYSDNIVAVSAMADTQRYLDMMKRRLDFLETFDDAGMLN